MGEEVGLWAVVVGGGVGGSGGSVGKCECWREGLKLMDRKRWVRRWCQGELKEWMSMVRKRAEKMMVRGEV